MELAELLSQRKTHKLVFPLVNNRNLSGQQLCQKLCLTLQGLDIFKSFNRVTALADDIINFRRALKYIYKSRNIYLYRFIYIGTVRC